MRWRRWEMELMRVRREEEREMKRLRSWKTMMRNCPNEGANTHNTGGLDWKDAAMVLRARVVIPTAADKHQATPA